MVNWRNTRLPKLEGENKITTIYEMVVNHTYELGFEYCSFTMSSQQQATQTKPIHFNNYPNEWNTVYKQAHFFDIDPVVAHCKRSVLPIVWDEKTFSAAPHLWSLAQSFGVHFGWTQAVHDFQGVFSMLTLGRSNGEVSPQELYEKAGQVLWLCHVMHAAVAQNYAEKPSVTAPCKLTPRETEILRWSALGKTASDIATILCLSERTVGFHISSCLRKLGVNNKIAAVLCASKAGLF
ncbi:LuxR family transcriptional regulator [Pseudomonas sp. WS 5532]|uniref:helix-turn-helix transcriptional regulator n=1 Tax=unclassified Pseudomonas TaxID=196821 RepID=UPI001475AB5C|nr:MULTISPECIES: LuxR family transcriptional regulator [unclassified Pseudomonas]MCF5144627.1 LuxR family transcriptional regulator [Pseudomonas sp. PA-6-3C]MCF5145240.1 LuxR family transcriptional regulator [Pseudomonas sp. PA-6-3F]MCF5161358.1 LuxR family transcriptional regulator [Pseudomonas sp. PA-6-2E]MCF5173803.1 LuxR family transcriptional regulator [Pseudomonas sp. PA-6-1D]MCF5192626.1 LuxR family transcriptional regulator [Pseudomonas sp. PA-6-1H]